MPGMASDSASLASHALSEDVEQPTVDFLLYDCFLLLPETFNPAKDRLDLSHLHSVVACAGRFHARNRCAVDTHPWSFDWETMLNYADQRGTSGQSPPAHDRFRKLVENHTIKKRRGLLLLPGGVHVQSIEQHVNQLLERLNTPAVRQQFLLCSKWYMFQQFAQEQPATARAAASWPGGLAPPPANGMPAAAVPKPRQSPFYVQTDSATPPNQTPTDMWHKSCQMVNETFLECGPESRLNMYVRERERFNSYLHSFKK